MDNNESDRVGRRLVVGLGAGAVLIPTATAQQAGAVAATGAAVPLRSGQRAAGENWELLQLSIDRLPAQGGCLSLPAGEFWIERPLTVPAGRSFTLAGQGQRLTTLVARPSMGGSAMLQVIGTASQPCGHVQISELTLRAEGHAVGLRAAHCFPKLVLRQVRVTRARHDAIVLSDCWGASLYDVEVDGDNVTDGAGIQIDNANAVCLYNPRIYNMKAAAASVGIHATSAECFNIYGGNIENCPRGIHIETGGAFGGPVHVDGVYFEPRAMQPVALGKPNDHILIEGTGAGVASVNHCLFQAGVRSVPIAFNAVRARGIGVLAVRHCVWQKARFRPGDGENVFIDADDTVEIVQDELNYLVSAHLGATHRIGPRVRHRTLNGQDHGAARPQAAGGQQSARPDAADDGGPNPAHGLRRDALQ